MEETTKMSPVKLIRMEFPTAGLAEIKNLTHEDKIQLASAIARSNKIPTEDLNFVPVEY